MPKPCAEKAKGTRERRELRRNYRCRALVRAALRAAADRFAAPLVRTALRAAAERSACVRRRAAVRACRASARRDAAERLSRLSARFTARARFREVLAVRRRPAAIARFAALRVFADARPFFGGGNLTPERRAFDNPIAMACLVDRAPCFPSRMWCISSRTNSPACVLGDFPSRASARARSIVSRSGIVSHLRERHVSAGAGRGPHGRVGINNRS